VRRIFGQVGGFDGRLRRGVSAAAAALSLSALLPALLTVLLLLPLATTPSPAQAAGKGEARAPSSAKAASRSRVQPSARKAAPRRSAKRAPMRRAVPSVGRLAGLHATDDELDLKSAVAFVVDSETDEVLFSKNPDAVLPIASITKLMTALVVVESGVSMDEPLTVTAEDLRATAGARTRRNLAPGTTLPRGEMLRLALMASENRAAHVLGRSHPGGVRAFVAAMNAKARLLDMLDTRYVEPTGLSSDNRSSAHDLARLVRAASEHEIIREYSTDSDAVVASGRRQMQFRNTNGLVHNSAWDIAVQKTGYIAAAGRCVVMQVEMAGRQLIMVLLDSAGRYSRIGDAERLRRWLFDRPEKAGAVASPAAAPLRAAAPAGTAGQAAASLLDLPVTTLPAALAIEAPSAVPQVR